MRKPPIVASQEEVQQPTITVSYLGTLRITDDNSKSEGNLATINNSELLWDIGKKR